MSENFKGVKAMIILIVLPLVVLLVLLSNIKLVKQHDRYNDYTLNSSLVNSVKEETYGMDQKDIMNYSIKTAASFLTYTKRNNIDNGEANCVGYAKLCASIYNYALRVNSLPGYAKPVVGYPKILTINLCHVVVSLVPTSLKSFVKDHDFVEFNIEGETIYADPCIYDFILSDCRTLRR